MERKRRHRRGGESEPWRGHDRASDFSGTSRTLFPTIRDHLYNPARTLDLEVGKKVAVRRTEGMRKKHRGRRKIGRKKRMARKKRKLRK